MFSKIFQSPALVQKFNHNHDDVGRFTDDARAVVRSGHAALTQSRTYGRDHSRASGAASEAANRARGSRVQRIASEVNRHFGIDGNPKVNTSTRGGMFPHLDADGNKQVQAVHSEIHRVARQKTGTHQAQLNEALYGAAHMKAGLHGNNAVIFQNDPHKPAAQQTSKKVILSGSKFRSVADASNALEASGLHGFATIHKAEGGGHEIHIDIPKQHSKHGRGLRAMVLNFRREHSLSGEHFNGERTLLRKDTVEAKTRGHFAMDQNHADAFDRLKTTIH